MVWVSLFAATILCGVFAEAHLFVPALVCTAWMVFVTVCNWVAEYRDERTALRQQDGSGC